MKKGLCVLLAVIIWGIVAGNAFAADSDATATDLSVKLPMPDSDYYRFMLDGQEYRMAEYGLGKNMIILCRADYLRQYAWLYQGDDCEHEPAKEERNRGYGIPLR